MLKLFIKIYEKYGFSKIFDVISKDGAVRAGSDVVVREVLVDSQSDFPYFPTCVFRPRGLSTR